jgi:hypothetical protein
VTTDWQLSARADGPAVPVPPQETGRWLPFQDWDWRHFLFYLGVPAILGSYSALSNWELLELSGYQTTLLFYAGHSFVPWWITCLATVAVFRLLRPWQPPQLLVLLAGSFLACLATLPYSEWVTEFFASGWFKGDTDGRLAWQHIYSQIGFWSFALRASVVWVAINLVFDRGLGLPRFRYAGATPRGPAVPPAPADVTAGDLLPAAGGADDGALRFLQRLPATVKPEEVIALKAEQHYIKVYTADRQFMTLHRFSDAVAEMDASAGQQVHRSFWVRTGAVRAIRRSSGRYTLELVNDLKVPVSAPNRGLLRELARQHGIPVYPPL